MSSAEDPAAADVPAAADAAPKAETTKAERPARKQVTSYTPHNRSDEPPPGATGYNIWYNRHTGGDRVPKNRREKATTKLDLKKDSGFTKGSFHENAFICLDFARGCCMKGADCGFLHKAPPLTFREDMLRDCFGRDKFRLDRQDMGGVGNFERDNRTLYVGGISVRGNPEQVLTKHFGQFGRVEHIRILINKAVGFVRYERRCCAEFAKEALNLQSLDNNEIINIRWAVEDPNPKSIQESSDEMTAEFLKQFLARKDFDNPDSLTRNVVDSMVTLDAEQYPDTTAQFAKAAGVTDPQAYAQWYAQYVVWWQQQQAQSQMGAAPQVGQIAAAPQVNALPAVAALSAASAAPQVNTKAVKRPLEDDDDEDEGGADWFSNPKALSEMAKKAK